MRQVHHTPSPQALKYRPKRFPMSRQLISHSKPGFRRCRASDEAVGLKLSQLLAKYFGGYPSQRAPKFAKSERVAAQALENHRLPSTLYDPNRRI